MGDVQLSGKTIIVTGVAGFIGMSVAKRFLEEYNLIKLIGIDNLNDYYDIKLKKYRLKMLYMVSNSRIENEFSFIKGDISDKDFLLNIFEKYKPDIIINLAAQAGVRYSIKKPDSYINSNIIGFYNIIEAIRKIRMKGKIVEHLVFASSSSVYGLNKKIPFSTTDNTIHPASLYAATKMADELIAYSYSKLYDIPMTGLRFFTVYGPAGRPDMAYYSFTKKICSGEKLKLFNYGKCKRDFTYIDDITTGIERVVVKIPVGDENGVPYKVYNIGSSHPETVIQFVKTLHEELKYACMIPRDHSLDGMIELVPMQPGDVEITYADISELERDIGFKPETGLRKGLHEFVDWYKKYY